MTRVAIVYASLYGHTEIQAQALADGARVNADVTLWRLPEDGSMPDGMWADLHDADAIVFGGPTYMGGPPWQFKKFADETSVLWET